MAKRPQSQEAPHRGTIRRVAFLSMDNIEAFECYDTLLEAPLAERGWAVDTVSWRKPDVDWEAYDAVVVRSPWDYQDDHLAFDAVLERIEDSAAQLENPLELMRWNMHKGYLRELDIKGIPIVPTHFVSQGEALDLEPLYARWDTPELIIKPAVSANADHTYRLTPEQWTVQGSVLEQTFKNKDALVQPFMSAIPEEGEFSLFFFGDRYSHTILKAPASGDFRVQEEHGGRLKAIEPDEDLMQAAEAVMEQVRPRPLYARVDLVRDTGLPNATGAYLLMELELIEPSLYFQLDADAPALFAEVFDAWMRGPEKTGSPEAESSADSAGAAAEDSAVPGEDGEPQDSDDAEDRSLDWIWG